jgi:hypothetical protein
VNSFASISLLIEEVALFSLSNIFWKTSISLRKCHLYAESEKVQRKSTCSERYNHAFFSWTTSSWQMSEIEVTIRMPCIDILSNHQLTGTKRLQDIETNEATFQIYWWRDRTNWRPGFDSYIPQESVISLDPNISSLAILLSCCLTILLSYYLTILLSYYLAILLSCCLTILLSYYLAILLSYYLTILLPYYLAILLSYYLLDFRNDQVMNSESTST